VKEYFEELKREAPPDVVFTHTRADLHQDHRLVCELTWNTFRDHLILEYEIPKFDGDLGLPNFFVHLDAELARRKIELLMKHFGTQRSKHWFTEDTFLALMRLRGVESRAPKQYAEGFHCRKVAF
jgi:LmbE family N-acetylglucosaminyl deacetylase